MIGCRSWLILASALTAIVHTSPVDWSKEVTVNINTARWTHLVHDKFLSFTLRPETLMKTEEFSKEMLTMAKGLSPAFVRICGPETNTMRFISSADSNDSSTAGEQWSKLYQFMIDADMDLIVCLNDKIRVRNVWDSGDALELISFSDRQGFNITWQLGYESQKLNWHPTYVSGAELGRDVVRLRKILDSFHRYERASIIGPDVEALSSPEDISFLKEYITEAGNALTALTWHQNFESKNTLENNETTDDMQILTKIMRDLDIHVWDKEVATLRIKKPVWIAEGSSSKETFSDAVAWIKRLGTAARLGFQVMMRQPSNEALHHQTPVYWASLLYRNLVGRAVLDTKITSADHPMVQVFSHCTAVHEAPTNYVIDTEQPYKRGTITVFGTNSADENIKLNLKASFREEEVHLYILTTDNTKSNNQRMTTFMNDKRLVLSPDGKLPTVSPEIQYPGRTVAVTVPAKSVFFIVLPTLQARTCMQYLGTTTGKGQVPLFQRRKITPKVTEMETDNNVDNHSLEAADSKISIKSNTERNKISVRERSITTARDRLIIPSRLRMNRQPSIRNKINEVLNKIKRDYIKYITFSDNAWLSKFPETNNSQEVTDEMMKQFEEAMQQADDKHQAALESIRNLNTTERRKLYLALTQAIIGKRKANDDSTNDNRDDADDSSANTDDDTSHTRNKNNYNSATTNENNSENKIKIDVTEDVARVKRFIEGKSTPEMERQLNSMQHMERFKPESESKSEKIVLSKNTQNTDTLLNVQNQVQQNERSAGIVRAVADQDDDGEDYIEEVKMLMESVLDEGSIDDSKHNISPRQLSQFQTDLVKRNDLLFKDDMSGIQELLEAELTPFEKANQRQVLKDEKSNFSIMPSKCNTEGKTNYEKTVENMKRKLEQHNKTLTSKNMSKEQIVQNDFQKSNIGKESDIQNMHMSTQMSPQPITLRDNNEDKTAEEEINTTKQNTIRYKRGEPSKNNLTTSLVENLSNETFEEKNKQIYLYLKGLAEEGERVLTSLYKEMEETNDDENNDEQTKIPVTESDTIKGNINNVLKLHNFLNAEFSESSAGNKTTYKRDTNIKPVIESVNNETEIESMKLLHPEESRVEEKIKLNFTKNPQHEVQLGMKLERKKLLETMMPDDVTDSPSLSSSSNFQPSENDQEYLSLMLSVTNDTNSDKLHNLNSTMNKYDTSKTTMKTLYEVVNKEESNGKSDTSVLSTMHKIHYNTENGNERCNRTVEEGETGELKATKIDKVITKEKNYDDYHDVVSLTQTPLQTMITVSTDEIIKPANNSDNSGFIKKGNVRNEKSGGVIMKISDKTARRIIGKRDKTEVLETDTYEENGSSGQNNETSTNLDPMKQSLGVRGEYTRDKAIRKRDDGSMIQEKQASTNNGTNLLNPVINNLQITDDQQNGLNVVSVQNNDLHSINNSIGLTNKLNLQNNSAQNNVHNILVNNTSNMVTDSESKTLNKSRVNISMTEGNKSSTVSEVTPPLQNNKRDPAFVYQQRKNRLEAFRKRLAETRKRMLNRAGINNNIDKRHVLIKRKRDADEFNGSEYILAPISKYIDLNGEDLIANKNDHRLANSDEATNTEYKESMKNVDDDIDINRMFYLLNQDDRSANNFHKSNNDNNLPVYRLIRLLTNSRQHTAQEQQNKYKSLCRDNSRHTSASDRALLIPINDVTTPIISDDVALEDTNIYTMIPTVMSERRFLRSIGNLQDKTDSDNSGVQNKNIKEPKFEDSEDTINGDGISESNKNFHITNINNEKRLESRKKEKVIPVLLIDPDDYIENCDKNKNIRLKRSITPIHSIDSNNNLKHISQNKINSYLSPIGTRSVKYSGTNKHEVNIRPVQLLNGRHKITSSGLLNKPKIKKRAVNDPQLNKKNSIKTLLSTNHISNESMSLAESKENDDFIFDSMLRKTFKKAMTKKKTNESSLARLYKLAKQYQKIKPKDDSIETEASMKSNKLGGNEFYTSKFGRNNNSGDDKTKNKSDMDNTITQERNSDNFSVKRNQLSDTNENPRSANNTIQIDVLHNSDLVMYLVDRIHMLFGFLNMLTGV